MGGGEQMVGIGVGAFRGLPLLGELEEAAVVLDGLEDLVGGELGIAEALVGEGGIALGHGALGCAGELLIEDIAGLAEDGGVGFVEVGIGEFALRLEVRRIGGGERAVEGERALLMGCGLGIVEKAFEVGELGEYDSEVALVDSGGTSFVEVFGDLVSGGEGLAGLGVEAELGFDGAEPGFGRAQKPGLSGCGGEVVGLPGEG